MEELISVIIAVYNVEEYLPRCLKGITNQSYKNLEIILVDDGSTDGTGLLCDQFAEKDSRAKVIHQPNRGLWAARNAGQDVSTGDFLWFADGDDYFHKDILRLMHSAITQTNDNGEQYDMVVVQHLRTPSLSEDVAEEIVHIKKKYYSSQDEIMYGLFKTKDLFTSAWNKLFRRSLVEDIRNENYARSQDWDYCFKVFLRINNLVKIDNCLYFWVYRPYSAVNSADFVQILAKCKTLMFYRNYVELPADKKKYSHYLLDGLYRLIIDFEDKLYGNNALKDVEKHCRTIIAKTWLDYLRCKEVPVSKKVSRLSRAVFPRLSHHLFNGNRNRL